MDMELLIERTERVQRDVGIADSLAYSARRDFGSLNNFEKADMDRILNDETTNLSKARNLIRTIVTELQEILQMIPTR
jgi:ERCC4-type nuclease